MSTQHTAIVPHGMTYVNAWYALYSSATEMPPYFKAYPAELSQKQQSVFRSIQETLLERFKKLPCESLLGASKNILNAFSRIS